MNDKIVATIRTTVAGLVGSVLVWLASRYGLVLDENTSDAINLAAAGVAIAAYHAVASFVQRRWRVVAARHPKLHRAAGWLVALLLGVNRSPIYTGPVYPGRQ